MQWIQDFRSSTSPVCDDRFGLQQRSANGALGCVLLILVVFTGCNRSGSGAMTYEFVEGKPSPASGAFRYDGVFNVRGEGIDAILVVDGNEVDRKPLPQGVKQKVTLNSSGLTAGQHTFELQIATNHETKNVANGIVVIK